MKSSTSLVIAGLLVISGCSNKKEEGTVQKQPLGGAASAPPAPPVEAPKPLTGQALAVVYQACVDQINAGKFDEFRASCLDASYALHEAGNPTARKADDVIVGFKQMKTDVPDVRLTPQLVIVSGRNVLAVELFTGTHKPSGKKLGQLMFHRVAINDANKASEEWSYGDRVSIMSQMGMTPKGLAPGRAAIDKGLDGAPIVLVATDDATEKANSDTVDKLVGALDAGKIPDALALLAPDVVIADQANASDIVGTKALEPVYKSAFAALKDRKHTFTGSWAAGNYVVRTGTFSATTKGKPFTSDLAQIFALKDGKVTHNWIFQDSMQMATQLGLVAAPAAPVAPTTTGSAAAPAATSPAPTPPPPAPSPTPAPPAPAAGSAAPAAGSAATK